MGVERFGVRALLGCVLVTPLLAAPAVAQPVGHPVETSSTSVVHRSADGVTGRSTGPTLHPPQQIRLLAARVYWGRTPPSYPSAPAERRELAATAGYFERISRGRETFRWTLTRWVHVSVGAGVICGTQAESARATRAALVRAGYHPGRYNRLMVVAEQCHAAFSIGEQPGHDTWIRYRDPGLSTAVHELGHNLGLGHAYGLACTQDDHRVALGTDCRSVEYGDDWDAMGHSTASYSVPILRRLGWAGRVVTVRPGAPAATYRIADVERSGSKTQGVRIRIGPHLSYWIEYQPRRGPVVGRAIPGITIRREVGSGQVQLIDASPGNPSAIGFPDRDLVNPALPVGSSLTTPENVRITAIATAGRASVRVSFGKPAAAPEAPVVALAARQHDGGYRVHWTAPVDNGQVVLGYRVTALPSGTTRYVRSPGGYRTSVRMPYDATGDNPSFTVEALNQVGWSSSSAAAAPAPAPAPLRG